MLPTAGATFPREVESMSQPMRSAGDREGPVSDAAPAAFSRNSMSPLKLLGLALLPLTATAAGAQPAPRHDAEGLRLLEEATARLAPRVSHIFLAEPHETPEVLPMTDAS